MHSALDPGLKSKAARIAAPTFILSTRQTAAGPLTQKSCTGFAQGHYHLRVGAAPADNAASCESAVDIVGRRNLQDRSAQLISGGRP